VEIEALANDRAKPHVIRHHVTYLCEPATDIDAALYYPGL
jgi:hypothetical protein